MHVLASEIHCVKYCVGCSVEVRKLIKTAF